MAEIYLLVNLHSYTDQGAVRSILKTNFQFIDIQLRSTWLKSSNGIQKLLPGDVIERDAYDF